ncbi:hypothetical protein BbiDN127_D0030 (plasmid) [Borreliella bissettiae DN127]|uniref:Uncharacterized protein n=1 Tax=Borrelia bissettiae (strain DSM 17990 / CIP 109136 / DN127) TaxID=521010 RepID=G0AP06_BORBD|nr:hypothetical protein BbiDN127_D0030 [Borreliella bissettiae DN127]
MPVLDMFFFEKFPYQKKISPFFFTHLVAFNMHSFFSRARLKIIYL